jgi:hypothetical protein
MDSSSATSAQRIIPAFRRRIQWAFINKWLYPKRPAKASPPAQKSRPTSYCKSCLRLFSPEGLDLARRREGCFHSRLVPHVSPEDKLECALCWDIDDKLKSNQSNSGQCLRVRVSDGDGCMFCTHGKWPNYPRPLSC